MKNTSKKQNGEKSGQNGRGNTPVDGSSVGQIRDILFGEQMSHYEERFAQLEASLEKRFTLLKASLEDSVSELKALVDAEKKGINTRNVSREMLADQLATIADAIRKPGG